MSSAIEPACLELGISPAQDLGDEFHRRKREAAANARTTAMHSVRSEAIQFSNHVLCPENGRDGKIPVNSRPVGGLSRQFSMGDNLTWTRHSTTRAWRCAARYWATNTSIALSPILTISIASFRICLTSFAGAPYGPMKTSNRAIAACSISV